MWVYRDDDFHFADPETEITRGDEVILLTHEDHLPELEKRWRPTVVAED